MIIEITLINNSLIIVSDNFKKLPIKYVGILLIFYALLF